MAFLKVSAYNKHGGNMQTKKVYEYGPLLLLGAFLFFLANNFSYVWEVLRIMKPILWGVAISYVMNSFCLFLKKKTGLRWSFSILLGYVFLLLFLAAFIWGLVPIISQNISDFIKNVPSLLDSIVKFASELDQRLKNGPLSLLVSQFSLKTILDPTIGKMGNLINNLSSYIVVFFKGLSQVIVGMIISIYILLNKDHMKSTTYRFMRLRLQPKREKRIGDFLRKADRTFGGFLVGKLIDSMIIGLIAFIGFLVLRVPFPVLMATIIGVTNIIPYFGPLIGGVPVFVFLLFISPQQAIITGIFIFALQQVDGYFIGPRILGESLGISPFWVILGVTIGGGFFGLVGMILGVPTLALLNSEFLEYLDRREAMSKMDMAKEP